MYLSNREKKLINIFLEQPNGVTIDYLSEQLSVSNRTTYRVISSMESALAQFQIKLTRDTKGYRLIGKDVFLEKLKEQVSSPLEELSVQQRQSKLIITLLMEKEEVKMESLAIDLNVSVGTIQSDLVSIEEVFNEYQIRINRRKAKGILAEASESNRRLIISGLITSEINEYDFFQLFDRSNQLKQERWKNIHNPFLDELNPEDLEYAYKALKEIAGFNTEEVTDTQFQRLVILLCISITRMKLGLLLDEIQLNTPKTIAHSKKSQMMATKIMENIQLVYHLETLPIEEKEFLALQIQGLNIPLKNEFYEDFDVNLGYKVRELIRLVSKDLGWDFYLDETLYQDLLQHVSAALNRAQAPMPESNNPLLNKIFEEYEEISFSVQNNLKTIFPSTKFLSNEVVYIVIHFASAYERNPRTQSLSVLVICSSGVGTAKILESRLKKHIPEITEIEISQISQLSNVHYEEYDLILSTVFLQGFETEYKVVTPLLMDDEVKSIKLYTRQILAEKKNKKEMQDQLYSHNHAEENDFKDFFEKLSEVNTVLENFDLILINNPSNIEDSLTLMCQRLEGEIVSNTREVKEKLVKRMVLAPIGLPSTNMALFHCIDEAVLKPYFAIFELSHPFQIQAMDKKNLQVKRVLMMLGPDPLSKKTQDILGAISAAIVESSVNMELFNSGSKELISQFLNHLYLEKIKA
ncbi:BglG family transcription antiterminator [Desemzia sp. FAM 24101]|uniref:BglG family transcription antiterminator n=1 Tax=unclassified Desemzia TaxID=2685243 RepID=UPI0038890543